MAQWAVAERLATIGLVCQAFGISQTCYLYRAKLKAENSAIADWLVRLANNQRKRFGLCTHFDNANVAGNELGRKVGAQVFDKAQQLWRGQA